MTYFTIKNRNLDIKHFSSFNGFLVHERQTKRVKVTSTVANEIIP
jgi:hypothetical protein